VSTRMEFHILGPLEVRANGELLSLGGPKQRALLAILLLSANRVVSRDRLVEELVGYQSRATVDHNLRVQISRLRKALASGGAESRLVTKSPGYLLRVEPEELDLDIFERHFSEGRSALESGDAESAAVTLREAESLWRGRPLADLEFEPFVRFDIERLEELHLAAIEERVDAELAMGRHASLVPELERLVAEHPLRERLRGQLMLALYRSGRQADALESYRAVRALLVEELALEPSPRLKDLEQAILRHDGDLELSGPARTAVLTLPQQGLSAEPTHEWVGTRAPRRRRRLLMGGIAAATVASAVVVSVLVFDQRHASSSATDVQADSVAYLDARSGKVEGWTPVGPGGGTLRAGEGWIWQQTGSGLQRIASHDFPSQARRP
jgi:DNA-binding SARP family transcriptional activator